MEKMTQTIGLGQMIMQMLCEELDNAQVSTPKTIGERFLAKFK